ncbi:methionine--tRNA ligase subunit beta [Candidatus Gottesmanbacteria bacterium]|nr:methionine--tRNA ligase subunit beta [Candidatus Gottesmanbacteria bacterium]
MQKPQISFSDFDKIDIRVGKVIDAVEVENSAKLIKLTVDLGEEYKIKTIFAGVKPTGYTPKDLIGKQFAFIANLAPRKMMGEESAGMMLAAAAWMPVATAKPVADVSDILFSFT